MDDKILIDTDVLIDFLRGDEETVTIFKEISNYVLTTTDINAFELYHGAFRSKNKSSMTDVENLLNSIEVLSTDRVSMKKAAEIAAILDNKGEKVDTADILIASLCITKSARLFTRNMKHFEKMNVRIFDGTDE